MCLAYGVKDISSKTVHTFEYWDRDEIEVDSERGRDNGSRKITEHITQILIIEENENNGRTTKE
jgi:hypothetical protein